MKEMLVFDLDDTLLTSNKTVSQNTIDTIKLCKTQGIIIGYITARARPFRNVSFFTDNLPLDFISYYNGASIHIGDSVAYSNAIPFDTAIKIVNDINKDYSLKKFGIYLEPWSYKFGEIWNLETDEKIKCDISQLPQYDVQRIRIVFNDSGKINLDEYMTNDTIYFITNDGSAFIVNKNATKDNALKKSAELFNIPLTDVIAFGDDINDTEMLKTAGIGVAMGNAVDSLKEIADYITQTNDNDGISVWINNYLLKR